jgi:hypothetical protein
MYVRRPSESRKRMHFLASMPALFNYLEEAT